MGQKVLSGVEILNNARRANGKITSRLAAHPKILKNWKLKMPVALFEIDLEEVFARLE